jgi:hypothetical protein
LTAAKATIDFGIGTSAEAGVVDGMVAAWIPDNIQRLPDAKVHLRATDARGGVVYDGSLPLL